MAKHAVGPMPIEDFMKFIPECLQRPDTTMPDSRKAFSKVPKHGDVGFKNERSLYDPINEAFNTKRKTTHGMMTRCPGVTFYNTSDQPGPGKYSTKVDSSGYAQAHLEFVKNAGSSAIVSNPGFWQLFWEGKMTDFAGESGVLFEHITDERKKQRVIADFGQTAFYAVQMLANQFRDFAFSISMTDETARLLRWDRSGVIFSEAIHYRRNPEPLCRFLWRFGNANPSQRGADMTVHQCITEAEEVLFRDTRLAKALEKHYEPGQVCIVEVFKHREDQSLSSVVEISKSGAGASSRRDSQIPGVSTSNLTMLTGLAVLLAGYWAVDLQTKTIVFLKDCWRAKVEAVDMEGLMLQNLRASVYVESHAETAVTLTSKHTKDSWNKGSKSIRVRTHYRMVTAEVGYALQETFAGTRELISGCQDVFHVLYKAITLADIMHRDISSTNIILVADEMHNFGNRVAYVIDWEFALAANRQGKHRDWWRTGTVAFMCINALPSTIDEEGHYTHFFGYDVESLVYVALYCGLYRLPWKSYSEKRHQFFLQNLFNYDRGCAFKWQLVTRKKDDLWAVFEGPEFCKWFKAALNLISMWYPTPESLPSPQAILTEFSKTVEVNPASLDERDAVSRKMPVRGLPIGAVNCATQSSSPKTPDTSKEPLRRLRSHVVDSSPPEGAPRRGMILRGRGQPRGSPSNAVGRNTRRRKQPGDEIGDGMDGEHHKKRKKSRK
ncbi:uncharacterized protein EV420DRAFT_1642074 [Desarmillaria tabescens]|uniref:Fungal-type protein kinase domain-containing protein n=1 Tax=Armillaria tabescens TaxID=1929756 RepID=A0AA39N6C1_ARMTA|nr:uncharacterized protein EV420DRAFT_1642074 [Desarmillaria tabescens]KAK0459079.1 hypothetical protein EV420DRAFT_1642074 [Desarmillaria tabescens]